MLTRQLRRLPRCIRAFSTEGKSTILIEKAPKEDLPEPTPEQVDAAR